MRHRPLEKHTTTMPTEEDISLIIENESLMNSDSQDPAHAVSSRTESEPADVTRPLSYEEAGAVLDQATEPLGRKAGALEDRNVVDPLSDSVRPDPLAGEQQPEG